MMAPVLLPQTPQYDDQAGVLSCLEVRRTVAAPHGRAGSNLAHVHSLNAKLLQQHVPERTPPRRFTMPLTSGGLETLSWKHKDRRQLAAQVTSNRRARASADAPLTRAELPWRPWPRPHQIAALANQCHTRLQPLALGSPAPPLQLSLRTTTHTASLVNITNAAG